MSGKSLNAAGISFWLAKAIDGLLPDSLGNGHDIRKLVSCHAWLRGIAADEIITVQFMIIIKHLYKEVFRT